MTSSTGPWTHRPLVALDLEGSGAQDHEGEAILEIAVVPITAGQPDTTATYTTLINPGRAIPHRPWISPGLTSAVLATAPAPAEVGPELADRLNGRIIVGHNIGVDWRLLHRRYPVITPAGLIDTLRLARHLQTRHQKQPQRPHHPARTHRPDRTPRRRQSAAPGTMGHHRRRAPPGRPHHQKWPDGTTIAELLDIAAIDPAPPSPAQASQTALF